MTNNFSDLLVPYKGFFESDLLELYTDKVTEFMTRVDSSALKVIDDDVCLLSVPDGYSIEVHGTLFFEDLGCLSYMSGDDIIPLYLDYNSMLIDWRDSAAGVSSIRSICFVFEVFCSVLFELTEDTWYMEFYGDVNSLCWALADYYDIEH